jgi:hypothetical protein
MRLLSVLAVALVASSALGQSVSNVSSVTGAISPGATLTISGSGFGSTGPEVVIFDDFEAGTNGTVIVASNAVVGEWASVVGGGTSPGVYYSNSSSVSGDLAFRANEDAGANYIAASWDAATEVFGCWWIRHEGTNWPGEPSSVNWKSVWLWELPLGVAGGTDLTLPTTVNGSTYYIASNAAQLPSTYGAFGPWGHDIWRRVAFWTEFDGATGIGDLDFWTVAAGDAPWRKTIERDNVGIPVAGHSYRGVGINGYGYNSSDSYPMFDDVYWAVGPAAQARVEIGDNIVYGNCTTLAILVPSSWSDTSISVSMRETQFAVDESAYLFVVDASGNASTGYPVTIGGTSGNPSAPGRPQNMTVREN